MKKLQLINLACLLICFTSYSVYSQPVLELEGNGSVGSELLVKNEGNTNSYTGIECRNASDISYICNSLGGSKSRGDLDNPEDVMSGDRVVAFFGYPYIDGVYRPNVAMEMFVGDSPSATSYPSYIKFGTTGNNETFRSERMRITENGDIGIGTIAPTERLDIDGNLRIRNISNGAFANDLAVTSDGTLTLSLSDQRMKKNISNIGRALEKVLKLQGVTYNWIDPDSSTKKDLGLIAQDVELVFPELVFTNKVDGYKGINYSRFPAIFIEAFKEQQVIIDAQNKKIEGLEHKMNEILKMMQVENDSLKKE